MIDARTFTGIFVSWTLTIVVAPLASALGIAPPDLLVVVVLLLGFERGALAGQFIGFLLGASIDLLAEGRVGPATGAYILIGHLGGRLAARFGQARRRAFFIVVPFAALLADLVAIPLGLLAGLPMIFTPSAAVMGMLSTLGVSPFVYFLRNPLGFGRRGG